MVGAVEQGETLKIKDQGGDPLNNQGLGSGGDTFKSWIMDMAIFFHLLPPPNIT